MLSLMPVEEVWGVGGRTTSKLHAMGITTALELARTNPAFIRRNFTVVLERTVRELRGKVVSTWRMPRHQNNRSYAAGALGSV
jgi:DNA polymerase V